MLFKLKNAHYALKLAEPPGHVSILNPDLLHQSHSQAWQPSNHLTALHLCTFTAVEL